MWNAPLRADIVGYRINRTIGGVLQSPVDISVEQFIENGNSWTDTGLRPGIQAVYTVQALWKVSGVEKPGAASNKLTVNPPGAAPGGVRGAVTSPTKLTVTWNAVPDVSGASVTGYKVDIYDRTVTTNLILADSVVVPATGPRSWLFEGLDPNTNYQIRVTPIWNTSREGKVSANVNVKTSGPAPTGFKAINVRTDSAQLTWISVPDAAVEGYMISRTVGTSPAVTFFVSYVDFYNANYTWTDTGLTPGVAVRYTVQALWEWDDINNEGSKPGIASARITVTPIRP